MKKIVLMVNSSWNVVNFRMGLVNHLQSVGYELVLACPRDGYTERLPCRHVTLPIVSGSLNPFYEALLAFRIVRILFNEKPDAVLTFTIKPNVYGALACRLLKVPVIVNVAGLGMSFSTRLRGIAKFLYRIALAEASVVFFQNTSDMEKFKDWKLVENDQASLLPGSGVDLNRFYPLRRKESAGFVFLFLGRLLWSKGVAELVRVHQRLSSSNLASELRFAGFLDVDNPDSITLNEMDALCRSPGVRYVGPSDSVEHVIAEADCVVLPTLYPEGLPRCLLEASAMSKPIIASDVPGCRDLIMHGHNGLLCAAGDEDDLYDQMKKMMELPDAARSEMGENAREVVECGYSETIVHKAYGDALEHELSRTRKR